MRRLLAVFGRSKPADPYWDRFINQPPRDPNNLVSELVRAAPEGLVNPTRADIHSPEITSSHIKELARFLGADLVGIIRRTGADAAEWPFAIVCAVRAEYDPREAPGIGGQVPVQNGQFVTFTLAAYIRELGYRATRRQTEDGPRLAATAGLGRLEAGGRLITPKLGARVYVDDPILTNLPLAADAQE